MPAQRIENYDFVVGNLLEERNYVENTYVQTNVLSNIFSDTMTYFSEQVKLDSENTPYN